MIKVKQELSVMIRQYGLLAVPALSVHAQLTGCLGVRSRIDETARRALDPMAVLKSYGTAANDRLGMRVLMQGELARFDSKVNQLLD